MGKKWEWKNRILGDFKSIMCLSLHKTTTVTLAVHVRRGLIIINASLNEYKILVGQFFIH